MHSHSENKRFFRGRILKIFLVLIIGSSIGAQCFGQPFPVQVTFSVLPPYTTFIYKEYQQLSATLLSQTEVSCYLAMSLEGEGGVHIFTDPGYKMPQPLILHPGVPYKLSYQNWQEVVNLDHVVLQGIGKEALLMNGLPPGGYNFCIRVMDYAANIPLSQDAPAGCANFIVSVLTAPVFVDCREVLEYPTPQSTNPVT